MKSLDKNNIFSLFKTRHLTICIFHSCVWIIDNKISGRRLKRKRQRRPMYMAETLSLEWIYCIRFSCWKGNVREIKEENGIGGWGSIRILHPFIFFSSSCSFIFKLTKQVKEILNSVQFSYSRTNDKLIN